MSRPTRRSNSSLLLPGANTLDPIPIAKAPARSYSAALSGPIPPVGINGGSCNGRRIARR